MAASNGIPDDVLRQLVSDPDFQKLDEGGQDRLLSRFAQDTYGIHPASENILQRAANAGQQALANVGSNGIDVFKGPGAQLGQEFKKSMFGLKPNPGGLVTGDMKGVQDYAKDFFTDPHGMAESAVATKGAMDSPPVKLVTKPSEFYGDAISKGKGNVNFLDIINKHIDDPLVKKVIDKSGVMERFSGSIPEEGGYGIDKLAKLNSQEAQDFINDVKVGQSKAFLSGDATKSNQIGLSRFFSDLSKAQSKDISGMGFAKKAYGTSKAVTKGAKAVAKRVLIGSELGAGAKLGYDLLK